MTYVPPKYTPAVALEKMKRYCAYQERCYKEVKEKLRGWNFYQADIDRIAAALIEQGFLNEERFVKAITGGKFRTKGWGLRKIRHKLAEKGISSTYLHGVAEKEISREDYRKSLLELLGKKREKLSKELSAVRDRKLIQFALGRGYDMELIRECLRSLEGDDLNG